MYTGVLLLILATILNLALSTNRLRMYEVCIYVSELLLIGICMTICSVYLIKLMNSLFGEHFVDVKTLRLSLIVFDVTYLIRAGFFMYIRFNFELYERLWKEHAFLIAVLYITTQIVYDVVPLALIFK